MAETEEFYKLEERQASGETLPDLERALIILRQSGVYLLALRAAKELAALRAELAEARPIIWGVSSLARTGHYDPAADKWLAKYPEGEK